MQTCQHKETSQEVCVATPKRAIAVKPKHDETKRTMGNRTVFACLPTCSQACRNRIDSGCRLHGELYLAVELPLSASYHS